MPADDTMQDDDDLRAELAKERKARERAERASAGLVEAVSTYQAELEAARLELAEKDARLLSLQGANACGWARVRARRPVQATGFYARVG